MGFIGKIVIAKLLASVLYVYLKWVAATHTHNEGKCWADRQCCYNYCNGHSPAIPCMTIISQKNASTVTPEAPYALIKSEIKDP